MHLCLRRHRVRLPVYPRSCPLHGLKTSRYRGACASAPHQGRSEFHRHRNQVLKPSRVSSLQLGINPPNLVQVRFLINESHCRYIYGPARAVKEVASEKNTLRDRCSHISGLLVKTAYGLRALMKSALPLLITTAASRALSLSRVEGSRSDLSCHQLEPTSHRAAGLLHVLIEHNNHEKVWHLFFCDISIILYLLILLFLVYIFLSPWRADSPGGSSTVPRQSAHSCSPPPPRSGFCHGARPVAESTERLSGN